MSFCEGVKAVKAPGRNKIEIIGHADRPRRLRQDAAILLIFKFSTHNSRLLAQAQWTRKQYDFCSRGCLNQ